jgi:hypothetical protein
MTVIFLSFLSQSQVLNCCGVLRLTLIVRNWYMKFQFIKIIFIGLAINPIFAIALDAPPFDYELQKKLLLEAELREKSALLDKSSSISLRRNQGTIY